MKFSKNEADKATIDWFVVAAGIVMMGAALGVAISASANDLSTGIGTGLDTMDPASISVSH